MADYRKLIVWQRAHALVLGVYGLTSNFPNEELFGLSGQARRAAASIPANIAEGSGRGTQAELARYCRIAAGSLNELEYHLLLAKDLGYLDPDVHHAVSEQISDLRRMLTRLIRTLRQRQAQPRA